MKFISIFLALILAVTACSSSQPHSRPKAGEIQNLVQLRPPGDSQKIDSSRVYVGTVNIMSKNDQRKLLIMGNFPDGCTQLQNANHSINEDALSITLTAWKPADKICTQAMVPFTFIYENVSADQLQRISVLNINKKKIKLK